MVEQTVYYWAEEKVESMVPLTAASWVRPQVAMSVDTMGALKAASSDCRRGGWKAVQTVDYLVAWSVHCWAS